MLGRLSSISASGRTAIRSHMCRAKGENSRRPVVEGPREVSRSRGERCHKSMARDMQRVRFVGTLVQMDIAFRLSISHARSSFANVMKTPAD